MTWKLRENIKLDLWWKQLMRSHSNKDEKSWHSRTRLVCEQCCDLYRMVHCVTRGRSVCFYDSSWKHSPNRIEMISPESHTILFLTSPMISVFFVPVGRFRNYVFLSCRAEEKHWFASGGVDIYILWKELIAPNFGFSSHVRLYVIDR